MTFGHPRFSKAYDWELIRYVVRKDTSVVGGFSKLLAYFRTNYPGSIVSYANRLYSNGKVYEKNGFKLVKSNPAAYFYYDANKNLIVRRYAAQKNMLAKIIKEKYPEIELSDLSEDDMAKIIGLHKVYDCGTLVYVLG
jgi:predicted GTPase